MPEIRSLTTWQTTQGPDYPDRSGDGKHGPDNFRNDKNETRILVTFPDAIQISSDFQPVA
jgi:hypothetical protein